MKYPKEIPLGTLFKDRLELLSLRRRKLVNLTKMESRNTELLLSRMTSRSFLSVPGLFTGQKHSCIQSSTYKNVIEKGRMFLLPKRETKEKKK